MRSWISVKRLLALAGAILLGALGSGLWESLLAPFFIFLRNTVLNLASLGIQRLKDVTYSRIAEGISESTAIEIYSIITALTVSFFFFNIYASWRLKRRLVKLASEEASEAGDEENYSREKLKKIITKVSLLNYVSILVGVVYGSFFCVSLAERAYANAAVVYFNQLLATDAPKLDPLEQSILKSQFAQIRTKSDYEKLVTKLKDVAVKSGFKVRDFDIW